MIASARILDGAGTAVLREVLPVEGATVSVLHAEPESRADAARCRRRHGPAAESIGFGRRFIAASSFGSVLNPVNSSIIAVALASIGRAFGAGAAATTWLVSALYLATAIGQPAMGRLADRLGPRRVYLGAMVRQQSRRLHRETPGSVLGALAIAGQARWQLGRRSAASCSPSADGGSPS